MAHNVEPMDIDIIHSDFDNKENSTQHHNLLPRTPCTEKGYEELDVSELNMKLRYSITPVSSPMSKSYTANCGDSKNQELEENVLNSNLTRSFNSAMPRNDVINKSLKPLPLQSMTTEQLLDNNRNASVLRPLDTTTTITNTTITVTEHNDIDDNLSIPSTISSNAHTPEVTTPTKDIAQTDGGSPIMRGLKTVLNMFRSSQSPIPPENDSTDGNNILSPPDLPAALNTTAEANQAMLVSTPIAAHKKEGNSSKRNSPHKESIVFNEDLEKELLWKEESTVLFSEEKIPIHKLLFQHPLPNFLANTKSDDKKPENLNTTVEYMDISYNDTVVLNKTLTDIQSGETFNVCESDSEFVDCETTLNDDVKILTPRRSECVTNETLENKQLVIETNTESAGETSPLENTEVLDAINQKLGNATENVCQFQTLTTAASSEVNEVANENGNKVECISAISSVDNQSLLSTDIKIDSMVASCTKDAENIPTCSEQESCDEKGNFKISATVGDGSNIRLIENEMKNKVMDIQNIPANIPLPEEDEIEINVDPSNYTTNTKLESTIPIDNMPTEITDRANVVESNLIKENTDLEPIITSDNKEIENFIGETPNTTRIIEHSINVDNCTDQINLESIEISKITADSSENDLKNIMSKVNNVENQLNVHQNDLIASGCSDIILEKCIEVNLETNEVNKSLSIDTTQKDRDPSFPEKDGITHELNLENEHTGDTKLNLSSEKECKPDDTQLIASPKVEIPVSDIPTLGANIDVKSEILPDLIPDTIHNAPAQISSESTDHERNTEISNIKQTKQNLSNDYTNDNHIKENDMENNVKEEEIQLSENNSPYVSISGQIEPISNKVICDGIENPFTTVTGAPTSPPISPKNVSKGYNFNFDDIDDPFATKTKIRLSPPLESLNSTFSPVKTTPDQNKRKSQPERKKPVSAKKNIKDSSGMKIVEEKPVIKLLDEKVVKKNESENMSNASELHFTSDFNNKSDIPTSIVSDDPIISSPISTSTIIREPEISANISKDDKKQTNVATGDNIDDNIANNEIHSVVESLSESIDIKNTSSSEQSTYYSAATSSGESFVNKNVFNIPEIDDLNFNPFATKSKVRLSLSPDKEDKVPSQNVDDKVAGISDEKDCVDISNTTCSSKATDEKDITVKEILTEDEDTMEGPFLETEDVNVDDKMSDDDNNDFMLSELPKQGNEDLDGGELFIDADAFEFLLNQNQHNAVADSAKESLFLKFDPLFAKRVSTDGVLSVLKNIQKRQSTPQKASGFHLLDSTFEKPIAGPSNENNNQEVIMNTTNEDSTDDLNVTVTKPTMVVTPAVNPIVTPRTRSTPVTNMSRRSITFTSPAIAVIDRLLSMSGNNSILGDTTVSQVNNEQNEADIALIQLREMLADKEIHVYNLRTETKELKDRLSNLESQMRTLESESAERLKKINELNETLYKKTEHNRSMAAVVEEYERTIASLIAETEQDKKQHNEERRKLIQERDEQTAHLASMEVSFSDLHNKYEKSKQIIFTYKANEDAYKKSIKEFEDNLSKTQSNYELLKQHATSKLNHANQELEKINRAHDAEVLKLNAMIKRKDVHITSLEETLAQKTKANEELAAICDELINKVG